MRITKIDPKGDYIVARRIKESETTEGGVAVTDRSRKLLPFAEIIQVGPLAAQAGYAVGQRILFPEYRGYTVTVNREDLDVLRPTDILADVEWEVTSAQTE